MFFHYSILSRNRVSCKPGAIQDNKLSKQTTLITWIGLRENLGELINPFLSQEALEKAKTKNWTFITLILVLLGTLADLLTLFGNIVGSGLVLSLTLLLILLFLVRIKKELRKEFTFPIIILVISSIIFSIFFTSQKLFAHDERGIIAEKYPPAREFQEIILNELTKISKELGEIKSLQKLLLGSLENIKTKVGEEKYATIISPYSGNEITGAFNDNVYKNCFSFYEQGEPIFRSADHESAAKILEDYAQQDARFLNYSELAELHCMLGFRFMHIDMKAAAKNYKTALTLDSSNIGALLGMASVLPFEANHNIVEAYKIAEKEKNLAAFPFIIWVDASRKLSSNENEIGYKLLESGLEIAKKLDLSRMVDRFNHLIILSKIKDMDNEQSKTIIENQSSNCLRHKIYIDQINCHLVRSRLFRHSNNKQQAYEENQLAIDIAEKKKDINASLYIYNDLLTIDLKDEISWRDAEKKMLDLLPSAEKLGNWDLQQMMWGNLANFASFHRQNPKLAYERMKKSIEIIENVQGSQLIELKDKLLFERLKLLANYSSRSGMKEDELNALLRIIEIVERYDGSRYEKMEAYVAYIAAFTRQSGWKVGDTWPLVEIKQVIDKYDLIANEYLENPKSINKYELDQLTKSENARVFPEFVISVINNVCELFDDVEEKDGLILRCLEYYKETLLRSGGNGEQFISEKYPQTFLAIIERALDLLKNEPYSKKESWLIVLSSVLSMEKDYKASFEIEKQMLEHSKSSSRGLHYTKLLSLAVKLEDKEAVSLYLPYVENYWISGKSDGFEWAHIVSALINAYHYLSNPHKELAYLCTAYTYSYSGEGSFESWQAPLTVFRILNLIEMIYEGEATNSKDLWDEISVYSEFLRLCSQRILDDEGSQHSGFCKNIFNIWDVDESAILKEVRANVFERYRENPSLLEKNKNLMFCDNLSVEQTKILH